LSESKKSIAAGRHAGLKKMIEVENDKKHKIPPRRQARIKKHPLGPQKIKYPEVKKT